jgi:hypothetical protein
MTELRAGEMESAWSSAEDSPLPALLVDAGGKMN